jgi:hypothetical protein
MGFEFDLVARRLRRKERRELFTVLTGEAGPYGEVTLQVGRFTGRAELSSAALPEAWLEDPDIRNEGPVAIRERTRLVVGGEEAKLTRNGLALSKEGRALQIELGARRYSYRYVKLNVEELRDSTGDPILRMQFMKGDLRVTVLSEIDPVDLALGLILQGADMRGLTVTSTVILNTLDFLFNSGHS